MKGDAVTGSVLDASSPARRSSRVLSAAMVAATLAALAGRVAGGLPELAEAGALAEACLPAIFAGWLAATLLAARGALADLGVLLIDVAIAAALLAAPGETSVALPLVLMHYALGWLAPALAATREGTEQPAVQAPLHPARLVAGSFASVILLGTLLLTIPAATRAGSTTSFVDALFTATSAVCVTGLIVVDTAEHFTLFGQVIIITLIQIGGLGIMTMSAASTLFLGHSIGLRGRTVMAELLDSSDITQLKRLTLSIVQATLLVELAGGLLLFSRFHALGRPVAEALWLGLFHSVSAFCNAGFALFSDSLMGFRSDGLLVVCVSALIILGGLGFSVLRELSLVATGRSRELSVHSRLVLLVTALLLGAGAAGFYILEAEASMRGLTQGERLLSSWFASVTPRTAGFNTLPMGQLSQAGVFLTLVMMFIGASPGSTGGGIKTSTLGVIVLAVRQALTGRAVVVFGRSLARATVDKAYAMAFLALAVVMVFAGVLCVTEDAPLVTVLFEATSAFGTVGLSLDFTAKLTTAGRLLISALMFTGRVGPLTLMLALGAVARRQPLEYPEGRVMIG